LSDFVIQFTLFWKIWIFVLHFLKSSIIDFIFSFSKNDLKKEKID
jgi:hypothetical protein